MKSSALVFAVMTGLVANQAFAAGTILLRGTVATNCSVSVTPNGNNLTLPITSGGVTNVGEIVETCNHGGGYTIKASSATGGKLVHTQNSSLLTTYLLAVQDGAGYTSLGTTPTTVRTVGALPAPTIGLAKALNVNVAAYSGALSGDYEDTITFSITTP